MNIPALSKRNAKVKRPIATPNSRQTALKENFVWVNQFLTNLCLNLNSSGRSLTCKNKVHTRNKQVQTGNVKNRKLTCGLLEKVVNTTKQEAC